MELKQGDAAVMNITSKAMAELGRLKQAVPPGKHIATGDIRGQSARLFREIDDKRIGTTTALLRS